MRFFINVYYYLYSLKIWRILCRTVCPRNVLLLAPNNGLCFEAGVWNCLLHHPLLGPPRLRLSITHTHSFHQQVQLWEGDLDAPLVEHRSLMPDPSTVWINSEIHECRVRCCLQRTLRNFSDSGNHFCLYPIIKSE
jgi:hypothetical protein